MADVDFYTGSGVLRKLKDMGDGTHAEVVHTGSSTAPTSAATSVTTVSDATAVQLRAGVKSWQARVVGTGAVTATVQIQFSNDGTNWMSHADYTLTLSGTTSDVDAFTEEDAYAYHRASVTAISGTGAAVTVTVGA